jgi:hypothetical protein
VTERAGVSSARERASTPAALMAGVITISFMARSSCVQAGYV